MKPAQLDFKPVPALIRDHMSNRGSQVAMRHKRYGVWREYTWREVGLYVEQLAAWIIESGDDSECVGIVGNNEPQLFWAEYAINSAGKTVVCLYPDLESAELAHILAETRPATIFVEDQEQADKILSIADSVGISRICYWDERGLKAYEDSRLISFE